MGDTLRVPTQSSQMIHHVLINGVRWVAVVTILVVTIHAGPALAGCPTGSYEWTDGWGNRICKSFDTGQTRTIEGSTKDCPTGTYQWVDSWGNPICKAFKGDAQYYDTSEKCPIGTYEWVDKWGNKVCKRF